MYLNQAINSECLSPIFFQRPIFYSSSKNIYNINLTMQNISIQLKNPNINIKTLIDWDNN